MWPGGSPRPPASRRAAMTPGGAREARAGGVRPRPPPGSSGAPGRRDRRPPRAPRAPRPTVASRCRARRPTGSPACARRSEASARTARRRGARRRGRRSAPRRGRPLADVALPVERPVRDQVGAAALEPLVEERGPRGPVERVAEERPARVVGAVDRRHLKVVPGGPVEVVTGVEPERRRDRIRDRLEQGRLLGPFPDEPGDLQEAAKAVDGRRVLGHGATKGSARLEPGCRAVL